MKRVIWTLFAGDKYPPAMLHEFCWSLEKHAAVINVALADISDEVARKLYCARGNVSFVRIPEKDYEELLGWRPTGWWWKLLFFAPDLDESILFCDVDTAFLKNPSPIFDWIEANRPDGAFVYNPMGPKEYSTALFYVNNKSLFAENVWEQVLAIGEGGPDGIGDQDWLNGCMEMEDATRFPRHFQQQYKLYTGLPQHDEYTKSPLWRTKPPFSDLISVTFPGRPKADEVIRQDMPHYQEIYDALYWDGR